MIANQVISDCKTDIKNKKRGGIMDKAQARPYREVELPETEYGVEVVEGKIISKLKKTINEWLSRNPLIEILDIVILSKSVDGAGPWEILFTYKRVSDYLSDTVMFDTVMQVEFFCKESSDDLKLVVGNWFKDRPQIELIKTIDFPKISDNEGKGNRMHGLLMFYRTKK